MERKRKSDPMQFFKVLVPGFHQTLNLPPATSKEIEKLESRTAFLESRIGTWKVSLCKGNNGVICLEEGWPQFVERHALSMGEFVFFEHTGDLHFKLTAYKTNFCENLFPVQALIPLNNCKTEEQEEEEEESTCFEKKMIPSYGRVGATVNIPEKFIRRNDFGRGYEKGVLIDPIGREWDVKLKGEAERGQWRMRNGWDGFYAANGLSDGDICVFRLNRRLQTATAAVFNVDIVRAYE
ncbi:B3 domain-containing protein REM-like 3 [Salvia divinorum]|uniref:B3 domain-containing protein REM-like 3 n=1 Tax=Salvia divinorum TaxID=28513 RepID=A0ABD1HAE1_SALDI